MRVQPYGVGSIMHVLKRGARGLPITRDTTDQKRFARLLYFANDEYRDEYWERNTTKFSLFERPSEWPERKTLVRVLAWVLMPNHFHLLLEEIREGGIAKFMQQLCGSMSAHFNAKYGERGSLFQGAYKGLVVDTDTYLRQLVPYIMVKNVFELYPGGYEKALYEFDKAWQWGTESYPFSSLSEYAGLRDWPIVEKGIIGDLFTSPVEFKSHAQEIIENRLRLDLGEVGEV
ncbi:transposase [Patescibacteria group bacterium]|nr:transposase [Patescibacteria group bacterium]